MCLTPELLKLLQSKSFNSKCFRGLSCHCGNVRWAQLPVLKSHHAEKGHIFCCTQLTVSSGYTGHTAQIHHELVATTNLFFLKYISLAFLRCEGRAINCPGGPGVKLRTYLPIQYVPKPPCFFWGGLSETFIIIINIAEDLIISYWLTLLEPSMETI